VRQAGIAFFSSLESASAKNFSDFANKFDSYPFAYTDKADVKVREDLQLARSLSNETRGCGVT
jgi:hypothetical protein